MNIFCSTLNVHDQCASRIAIEAPLGRKVPNDCSKRRNYEKHRDYLKQWEKQVTKLMKKVGREYWWDRKKNGIKQRILLSKKEGNWKRFICDKGAENKQINSGWKVKITQCRVAQRNYDTIKLWELFWATDITECLKLKCVKINNAWKKSNPDYQLPPTKNRDLTSCKIGASNVLAAKHPGRWIRHQLSKTFQLLET